MSILKISSRNQVLVFLVLLLLFFQSELLGEIKVRPANWAEPMIGSTLENWYRLNDKVYRSEQPDENEFARLEQFGIKAVLNLRYYHSDKDETEKTRLQLYRIKMEAGSITYEQLVKAMKAIKAEKGPVLIHCWHGSDRTGAVSAAYRIAFQNWSKEEAVEELINGGFGYHAMFDNIPKLLLSIDVEKFKKKIGLIR